MSVRRRVGSAIALVALAAGSGCAPWMEYGRDATPHARAIEPAVEILAVGGPGDAVRVTERAGRRDGRDHEMVVENTSGAPVHGVVVRRVDDDAFTVDADRAAPAPRDAPEAPPAGSGADEGVWWIGTLMPGERRAIRLGDLVAPAA